MENFEEFVKSAQEFCVWSRSHSGDATVEARTALSHLLRLYALALELQMPSELDYNLEGETPDDKEWREVFERAGALPFNNYSSVFDPHSVPPETPVVGDLADDIADIYRDLSEGLSLYAADHIRESEWAFVNSFRTHWGRHASSAIRAIHCWFADTGKW